MYQAYSEGPAKARVYQEGQGQSTPHKDPSLRGILRQTTEGTHTCSNIQFVYISCPTQQVFRKKYYLMKFRELLP